MLMSCSMWNHFTQRRIILCLFIYLFIYFWPQQMVYLISVPWPGIEPRPQQWKPRILTTRPPGHSLSFVLFGFWMFGRCLQRWIACLDYMSLLTRKHKVLHNFFFWLLHAVCGNLVPPSSKVKSMISAVEGSMESWPNQWKEGTTREFPAQL